MMSHDDHFVGQNHPQTITHSSFKPPQNHAETIPKAPPDPFTIPDPVTSAVDGVDGVDGVDYNAEWVQIGDRFLPKAVNGKQILRLKARCNNGISFASSSKYLPHFCF